MAKTFNNSSGYAPQSLARTLLTLLTPMTKTRERSWTKPEWAAMAGVAVNLVLTGVKFALAFASGSLSLKVEAFHSFADVGSSLMVWLAVHGEMVRAAQSNKQKRSKGRPFLSQQKVAFFIGCFLTIVGIIFIGKVFTPEKLQVSYPAPVALVMLGMATLSYLLARFEHIVGETHDCTALVADSFHAKVDMFGSLVVAIALFGESLGLTLDRWGALVLAVFVLFQAANVFGALICSRTGNQKKNGGSYHLWLWFLLGRFGQNLAEASLTLLMRAFGWSATSDPARDKAKRLMAVASAGLFLVGYLATGLFMVGPGEQAIVEIFGKPVAPRQPLGPGLHYRFPWPFANTQIVQVSQIRRLTVGSSVQPDRRTILWTNRHYDKEFNLLTGENIFIDVGIIIHYRIADTADWLYGSRDPEGLVAAATESAITELLSSRPFLTLMTSGRQKIEEELCALVKKDIASYATGVDIMNLHIRDIHPPIAVAEDFEAVVSAMVEYETAINEARGYANALIPRARGKAQVSVLDATAKRDAAQRNARAKVSRFVAEQNVYRQQPAVTRTRMRIEALESVLPGRTKIIVPSDAVDGAVELILTAKPSSAQRRNTTARQSVGQERPLRQANPSRNASSFEEERP